MGKGMVIGGGVLLVLTSIGYLSMQSTINDCNSFLGELSQEFSNDTETQCSIANIIQLGSMILGLVGLLLFIVGLVRMATQRSTRSRRCVRDVRLGSTTGLEFENVCEDILKKCGLKTKSVWIDTEKFLLTWNKHGKIVVECKHQLSPIGFSAVQKVYSDMMTANAAGGIIFSTSGFTKMASRHPNSHTSSNILNFIRVTHNDSILLVDLDGLRFLAGNANIRLRVQ